MNSNFFKGKRILITGHTGFKGSWLSIWLKSKGAHVIGYALHPPTDPSLFEIARVAEGMTSIAGDVRDLENLRSVVREHRPEIIVHMAAQSLVRYSYDDPVETYSTNVMGTVNVLEACRHADNLKVVLIITSDKCYDNREWVWGYRENDPMGGLDPYSSSKGCAELVTSAYIRSFFTEKQSRPIPVFVASARAGNVVGGGDWAMDRLVPDMMKAILEKRPVVVRSPHAIRPWQHVLEPLRGYLVLVRKLWEHGTDFSGAWNFGPLDQDARPVSWIVERLKTFWGEDARWEIDSSQQPHEATYLKLDCSKARSFLNWAPLLTLEDSLKWIVEWYRAYSRGEDMRKVTGDQIHQYEELSPGI